MNATNLVAQKDNSRIKFAHVSELNQPSYRFHIFFDMGEYIYNIGDQVAVTANNGYDSERRVIHEICKITVWNATKDYPAYTEVEYTAS